MNEEMIKDIVEFFQLIGAVDELSERDLFSLNEILDEDYKQKIKELSIKYDIKLEGEEIDDYLDCEDSLSRFFKQQLRYI